MKKNKDWSALICDYVQYINFNSNSVLPLRKNNNPLSSVGIVQGDSYCNGRLLQNIRIEDC